MGIIVKNICAWIVIAAICIGGNVLVAKIAMSPKLMFILFCAVVVVGIISMIAWLGRYSHQIDVADDYDNEWSDGNE